MFGELEGPSGRDNGTRGLLGARGRDCDVRAGVDIDGRVTYDEWVGLETGPARVESKLVLVTAASLFVVADDEGGPTVQGAVLRETLEFSAVGTEVVPAGLDRPVLPLVPAPVAILVAVVLAPLLLLAALAPPTAEAPDLADVLAEAPVLSAPLDIGLLFC